MRHAAVSGPDVTPKTCGPSAGAHFGDLLRRFKAHAADCTPPQSPIVRIIVRLVVILILILLFGLVTEPLASWSPCRFSGSLAGSSALGYRLVRHGSGHAWARSHFALVRGVQ